MNGTCNYILTRMENAGLPYDTVFNEANDLGYLEADPTLDVGGIDAGHKLALLSSIAFGTQVDFDGMDIEGLEQITIADIGKYGLILPPRHLSTWHIVKMVFAQHNVNFRVTLEAGGWEVIKRYVGLGQGISIVTDVCITEEDRSHMSVIPVGQYFPQRSYGIVTRKGKFLSAPAQRFIEIMNGYFGRESVE